VAGVPADESLPDPGRSKQVLDLCDEALMRPVAERGRFLATRCDGDPELLAAVESLLKAVEDSGNFLVLESRVWGDD
jgi:hypothetical protein